MDVKCLKDSCRFCVPLHQMCIRTGITLTGWGDNAVCCNYEPRDLVTDKKEGED